MDPPELIAFLRTKAGRGRYDPPRVSLAVGSVRPTVGPEGPAALPRKSPFQKVVPGFTLTEGDGERNFARFRAATSDRTEF